MQVFLDIPPSLKLEEAGAELGCKVEQLFTPLTRYNPQKPGEHFAIDNGAYSGLRLKAFEALLTREFPRRKLCRWVAVPDVVGSARRTRELFDFWSPRLVDHWKLAYVAQDGQADIDIPWDMIDCIFIGGTTEFKMGSRPFKNHVRQIINCAKGMRNQWERPIWIHVGRVNTPGRFGYFKDLGADSIDGTGLAKYTWMRHRIHDAERTPKLITDEEIKV